MVPEDKMSFKKHPKSSTPFEASFVSKIWRTIAWATSLPPLPNVPHLRGSNFFTGRLDALSDGSDGILRNLSEAHKLAQTSPSQMCTFWVQNKLILVLTKPEDIYEFKLRCHNFMDRTVPFMEIFPGHSRLNSNGKAGLELRALYKKSLFDTEALVQIEPKIQGMAEGFLEEIRAEGPDRIWDSKQLFRKLILGMSKVLFMGGKGIRLDTDDDAALEYLDKILKSEYANTVNVLGFRDAPLTAEEAGPWLARGNELRAEFKAVFLAPYEKDIKAAGPGTLFHDVLSLDGPDGDLEKIVGDTYLFTIGGLITTLSDTFPLVISNICAHQEIQVKLEAQLRREQGGGLEYLDNIIKETLRISPPVPIIPLRGATVPFNFKGFQVARGDHVLISPYLVHHNEGIWGENAAEFYPERFETFSTEGMRGAYFPFGLGPRDCVGRRYGMLVLKTFLGKLFTEFDVRVEGGNGDSAKLVGISFDKPILLRFLPRDLE